jgi:hypothetical protein
VSIRDPHWAANGDDVLKRFWLDQFYMALFSGFESEGQTYRTLLVVRRIMKCGSIRTISKFCKILLQNTNNSGEPKTNNTKHNAAETVFRLLWFIHDAFLHYVFIHNDDTACQLWMITNAHVTCLFANEACCASRKQHSSGKGR